MDFTLFCASGDISCKWSVLFVWVRLVRAVFTSATTWQLYRYQTCHCPPCPSPTSSWFTEPIAVTKLSWTSAVVMVPSNMITAAPPWLFWKKPLVYQIHTQKTPGGFNYLRKIFSFHSPEMTNCALWTFCSNVLFLSMKDVMIDLRCNESWCWLLTLSLINLPAVKSSCDTWLSQADCDAVPRLSLQTPGLNIPHVLNLFLFFCNFRCRRLLLESWEASMNSISFSQVDQLGLPITIGKRVFVITFHFSKQSDSTSFSSLTFLLFYALSWSSPLLLDHFTKANWEVCGI